MSSPRPSRLETGLLTAAALLCFAFNSIFTRLALGQGLIGAPAFTAVRLAAGALVLALLVRRAAGSWQPLRGRGLGGPLALFAYAAPFSFAYLRLGAATGSLVLFGSVQLAMIGWGVARGERPGARTWLGLLVAATGLAALTLPAASRPDPLGTLLMMVAGSAWAAYSLQDKRAPDPLAANARAFLWSAPVALLLGAISAGAPAPSGRGLLLAALSGAVTSGLGYAVWYRALRGLAATQAAIVQLAVPVIAATAAVLLLGEPIGLRLLGSGLLVLGGVALALSAPGTAAAPAGRSSPRWPWR
jgi:drug/metabolite transporter (DMT)-like permease